MRIVAPSSPILFWYSSADRSESVFRNFGMVNASFRVACGFKHDYNNVF